MSDSVNFYLARHGQTVWNLEKRLQGHLDSPLTPLGLLQAESLAEHVKDLEFAEVWCSSSGRTQATAKIVASKHLPPLVVQATDELRELNLGPWEGRTKTEVFALWGQQADFFWSAPEKWNPHGCESFEQGRERLARFLVQVASKGAPVLLVTHGLAIQLILWAIKGGPLSKIHQNTVVHQASLTLVKAWPSRPVSEWQVAFRDDRTHLKGLIQPTGQVV